MWDDDKPRKTPSHEIGQPLDTLSLSDLDERIALLRAEIARIEAARAAKEAAQSSAERLLQARLIWIARGRSRPCEGANSRGRRPSRLPDGLSEFPRNSTGSPILWNCWTSGAGTYALPDDMGRSARSRCCSALVRRLPGYRRRLRLPGFEPSRLPRLRHRGGARGVAAPNLRWLTLTDNRIAHLPDAIGRRPLLQKLMLSGNELSQLPETLREARNLELIRFASNRFERLPPWLAGCPRSLGSPIPAIRAEPDGAVTSAPLVPWSGLTPGPLLGEGSSGHVYRASRPDGGDVALKLFKGTMGSDGLPEREMAACLAAGDHPALIGALGRLAEHPDGTPGLPPAPPSPRIGRCSRGRRASRVAAGTSTIPACASLRDVARRILADIASALAHLHARRLMHGDLYGHNICGMGAKARRPSEISAQPRCCRKA